MVTSKFCGGTWKHGDVNSTMWKGSAVQIRHWLAVTAQYTVKPTVTGEWEGSTPSRWERGSEQNIPRPSGRRERNANPMSKLKSVMCGSGDLKPTKGMWANGKPSVSEKRQSHLKPFQVGSIPTIPIFQKKVTMERHLPAGRSPRINPVPLST